MSIEQNIARLEAELAALKATHEKGKQQPRYFLESRAVGGSTVNYTVYDRENPNTMHARFFCSSGSTHDVFNKATVYVEMLNAEKSKLTGKPEPSAPPRYTAYCGPGYYTVLDRSRDNTRVAKFTHTGGPMAAFAKGEAERYADVLNKLSK